MAASLFLDFSPSGKDAWERQAQKELRGKLETLSDWTIGPDLHLEPYLTRSDVDHERMAAMQACQKMKAGWQNLPVLKFSEPRASNAAMKKALESGADAIMLDLGEAGLAHCEFPKLLHGIRLSDTAVYFKTSENAASVFGEISKNAGYYLKGGIAFDPVTHWMRTGIHFDQRIDHIVSVLNPTRNMREFRAYQVDGHLLHNNGATQIQELAMLVSATVQYLDLLTEQGVSALTAFNRALFSISIGPAFLAEIAKMRALRFLLRKISDAYQLPHELCQPFIQAQTSTFYNAGAAPHTNMVRAASEAMSAVIGGCNALTVIPYDANFQESNDFSARVARNVSNILSHESALAYVADPAAGSYMIEKMSLDLADQAWKLFLEMEDRGGFVKCFETGFIQKQLDASLSQKVNDLREGKVIIGVNRFSEDPHIGVKGFGAKNDGSNPGLMSDKSLEQCFQESALTAPRP